MSHANHVVDNLSAYLDGALNATARAAVESHLRDCAQCQHDLASLRYTVRLMQALPPVRAPRSFTLSNEQAARARGGARPGWLVNALRGVTAAATVLFLLVVSADLFALNQMGSTASAPVPPSARSAASSAAETAPSQTSDQTKASPTIAAAALPPAVTTTPRPFSAGADALVTPAASATLTATAKVLLPATPQPTPPSAARSQDTPLSVALFSPLRLVEIGLLGIVALGIVAMLLMRRA